MSLNVRIIATRRKKNALKVSLKIVKIHFVAFTRYIYICIYFKNSIIHEENTKKNLQRVVSLYVVEISLDLHKL